jgi:hypothetical protein
MRSIIDGKRYDTETATEVAEFANGDDRSNFHFFAETLYLTAKGSWFLFGRGHARSPYAESYGQNTLGWGGEIRAMSHEEAQDWLEQHQEVEALEAHFADVITDA